MVVGFKGMTVPKDQELRNQLREAGVSYEVVKNTLARKAAEGTALEQATDQFKGVTAVALSNADPVNLSKAIAKFAKANPEIVANILSAWLSEQDREPATLTTTTAAPIPDANASARGSVTPGSALPQNNMGGNRKAA